MAEALSNNVEVEQMLKSFEARHRDSHAIVTEKSLQLQAIIQSATAATEEAQLQLTELQMCFKAVDKRM